MRSNFRIRNHFYSQSCLAESLQLQHCSSILFLFFCTVKGTQGNEYPPTSPISFLLSCSTRNSLGKHQRSFSLCFDICCPHIPQTLPVTQTSHPHKPAYVRQSIFFIRSSKGFASLLASSVEKNYSDKTTGKTETS